MTDYTNTFDGVGKDTNTDPILGVDHDTELDNISTAIASKATKIIAGTSGNLIEQDAGGDLVDSGIDSANLDGLTGVVQTQIDGKADQVAVVADHTRCGSTQVTNGEQSQTSFNLFGTVTIATWESVGPTGSGADNIWTALDALPADAGSIICYVAHNMLATAAGNYQLIMYVTNGDDSTPLAGEDTLACQSDADSDGTVDFFGQSFWVYIPLNSANVFKVYWNSSNTTTQNTTLLYRGFMND